MLFPPPCQPFHSPAPRPPIAPLEKNGASGLWVGARCLREHSREKPVGQMLKFGACLGGEICASGAPADFSRASICKSTCPLLGRALLSPCDRPKNSSCRLSPSTRCPTHSSSQPADHSSPAGSAECRSASTQRDRRRKAGFYPLL